MFPVRYRGAQARHSIGKHDPNMRPAGARPETCRAIRAVVDPDATQDVHGGTPMVEFQPAPQ
jgi:hypothetical protein